MIHLGSGNTVIVMVGITLPNEASITLHRRFGFESCGVMREVGRKFDRYWDVAWYERPLDVQDSVALTRSGSGA